MCHLEVTTIYKIVRNIVDTKGILFECLNIVYSKNGEKWKYKHLENFCSQIV